MLTLNALFYPPLCRLLLATHLQLIVPERRILMAVCMSCMFCDLMFRLFIQTGFPASSSDIWSFLSFLVRPLRSAARVPLFRLDQPTPVSNTGGHPIIDNVPHELYLEIFQYLSIDDLHAITQTNRPLSQHVMPSYFQRTGLNVPVLRNTRLKLVNSRMLHAALVWMRSPA